MVEEGGKTEPGKEVGPSCALLGVTKKESRSGRPDGQGNSTGTGIFKRMLWPDW